MRYLGGKARIAKDLVAALPSGLLWWEPFVGGANVTPYLRPVLISDRKQALVSLYTAVRDGWDPPTSLTEDEFYAARELPDEDPRKAFAYGCAFGGDPSGGFARKLRESDDFAGAARRNLVKLRPLLPSRIEQRDFLTCPSPEGCNAIYADPPYEGTTGYGTPFDHASFWARCQEYVRAGWYVAVSEYQCPVPHRVIWEKRRGLQMQSAQKSEGRLERLFEIVVPVVAVAA